MQDSCDVCLFYFKDRLNYVFGGNSKGKDVLGT